MGCCASAHAEARECELPPPMFGKDVKVKLKKQFMSADYTVYDELAPKEDGKDEAPYWMLMDAVGSLSDGAFDFFLKYRPKGVEESLTLGAVNMQMTEDYMHSQCTSAEQSSGRRMRTMNKRRRFWTDKKVSTNFIIARRCRIYADKEMTQFVGRLQILGSGTYHRHWHKETWLQRKVIKNKNGSRTVWRRRSSVKDRKTSTIGHFQYDMNCYGTDFYILFDKKEGDSWFSHDELYFQAYRRMDNMPLFSCKSNGKNEAEIQSFNQSDPVTSIIAGFAVGVKMDPKDFQGIVEKYNVKYTSLDSFPGQLIGFGENDMQYNATHPTPGEMPAAGFAYGVAQETVQAYAVGGTGGIPTAVPFTPIAEAIPVEAGWIEIPMAEPIVCPEIPMGTVLPESDGAVGAGDNADDGDDDDDGDLNGEADEDGADDKEEEGDDDD